MQAESYLSSEKANPCNWNKSLIEVIEVVRIQEDIGVVCCLLKICGENDIYQ